MKWHGVAKWSAAVTLVNPQLICPVLIMHVLPTCLASYIFSNLKKTIYTKKHGRPITTVAIKPSFKIIYNIFKFNFSARTLLLCIHRNSI